MNFEEIYLKRRSNRFLSNESLPKDTIDKLVNAGEHAPVAKGKYDDILLYIIEKEKLEALRKIIINEFNKDITFNCGCLMLILHKGQNKDLTNQDAGCILENICLEAESLNIGSVYVYSVAQLIKHSEKSKELLKVDPSFDIIAGVCLGYKTSDEVREVAHKIKTIY